MERIVIGVLFVIIGLVIVFKHEWLIRNSNLNSRVLGDDRWTGNFTRGGKIFLYLLGAVIAIYGFVLALTGVL